MAVIRWLYVTIRRKMDKQLYEFTYWLGLETEPGAEEQKLLDLIAKAGGEVAEKVMPRKRRLAYPIEQQTIGSLGTIYFWLMPEAIPGLKEEIRQIRTLLRSILLHRKKNALEPVKERRPSFAKAASFAEVATKAESDDTVATANIASEPVSIT